MEDKEEKQQEKEVRQEKDDQVVGVEDRRVRGTVECGKVGGRKQRFQPSDTLKRKVVQVLVILVLKEGLDLFVSKFVTF